MEREQQREQTSWHNFGKTTDDFKHRENLPGRLTPNRDSSVAAAPKFLPVIVLELCLRLPRAWAPAPCPASTFACFCCTVGSFAPSLLYLSPLLRLHSRLTTTRRRSTSNAPFHIVRTIRAFLVEAYGVITGRDQQPVNCIVRQHARSELAARNLATSRKSRTPF